MFSDMLVASCTRMWVSQHGHENDNAPEDSALRSPRSLNKPMGFRDVSDAVTLTMSQVNTCVETLQQEHQRCQLAPLSHKSPDIWILWLEVLGQVCCTSVGTVPYST